MNRIFPVADFCWGWLGSVPSLSPSHQCTRTKDAFASLIVYTFYSEIIGHKTMAIINEWFWNQTPVSSTGSSA